MNRSCEVEQQFLIVMVCYALGGYSSLAEFYFIMLRHTNSLRNYRPK
jgi:hypothetical protein